MNDLYREEDDNHKKNPDPFLFASSKVMSGQGRAVVCCVGASTLLARSSNLGNLVVSEQFTLFEQKLEKIANQITKYAYLVTLLCVITQVTFVFIMLIIMSESPFTSDTLLHFVRTVIVAIVLLSVAIPEGLPLAVSISMALSVDNLKKDNILIKNLESVQTCAMLHDICVSKTGTLTKGKLVVKTCHLGNQSKPESIGSNFFQTGNQEIKNLIKENIISNTDVRIEMNKKTFKYEPQG